MSSPVLAANAWPTNADLIVDVARLGYLQPGDKVWDATWGKGVWWKAWRPKLLYATDLRTVPGTLIFHADQAKPVLVEGEPVDFRKSPFDDHWFDVATLDGPYKLNGTSSKPDARYGVDEWKSWQDRHALIRDGMTECARVTRRGGVVLVKCQAQVCGGHIRWQDVEFANHGADIGLDLIDRFDLLGKGRPQPARTRADGKPSRQEHAYGRPSTLLVFRVGR